MVDEEKETKPKKTRKKYTPAKLIFSKGKISVYEWLQDGVPYRGILPVDTKLKDGKLEEGVLNTAMEYGVPWDDFIPGKFDAQKLKVELSKKGIWTLEDANNNLHVFGQIILQVFNSTRNDLLSFAKKFENTK